MIHEIDSTSSTTDEEDLHDGVVETDEAGEQVEIPADKHHQEQDILDTSNETQKTFLHYINAMCPLSNGHLDLTIALKEKPKH